MSRKPKPIASPCTDVCKIDRASRLCIGCFRTPEEINKWLRYSDGRRKAVLAELPKRRAEMRKPS